MPWAQTQPATPSATPHLGWQKSLIDFYSSSQNSRRVDYGPYIEEWRKVAISNTLESYDFWVAIVSLVLSGALFVYILHTRKKQNEIMVSTAQLISTYHNQLSTGQRAYQRLQEQYRKFLNAFELEKEPRLSAKPPAQKPRAASDNRGNGADQAAKPVVSNPDSTPQANGSAESQESFDSMRRQISVLSQQLELERQKNRKLRGE